MPAKVLFEETQRSVLLVVAAALVTVFFGVFCLIQIGFQKPVGNHPAPNSLLICIFIASVFGTILFNNQKLKLVITEDEINISYGILTSKKTIRVSDIKSISVRKYNALKEFVGWGVRFNDKESCFTVSGDDGLEIALMSNEMLLIGTQMPDKLQLAIDTLLINHTNEHKISS